jgi:poly(hydroxyalkanoate) depolymerase family esterase
LTSWKINMSWKQILLMSAMATILLGHPPRARAGDWVSGSASNSSGSRNYKLWVPSGYNKRKSSSLVMMLHGCMQKPEDLATLSGMNEIADRNNFLVVYPEQTAEANPLRCWNWFDPKHQARDSGEPALLAAVVKQVQTSNSIDSNRIFVAGISAGAAMAVVMGVTYPDLFDGIGVCAGLEFKAGTSAETGLAAMKQGGPDPKQQGIMAFNAIAESLRGKSKPRMPVIVFQGDGDPYVNPLNAEQLISQWSKTNDYLDDGKDNDSIKSQPASQTEGSVPGGHQFTKSSYNDRDGRLIMEKWMVKGLGHAWSGSPTAGPFADPKGPNASLEMWRFFTETTSRAPKPKAAKPRG